MKIKYKVLWFDDTREWFDSQEGEIDNLKETISRWGFEPDVELVITPEALAGKSPFSEYDLIVIDYNLEGYGHGEEFIDRIRSHDVYTEIVFYSAQPAEQLWDAVRERKLEGVFIANRRNVFTKIEQVSEQSIKKVLDLENMRGIVMAEVGDIDHIIDSILNRGLTGVGDGAAKEIFASFHRDAESQARQNLQRLDDFSESPSVSKLIALCDSYKRWNNFQRLVKVHPSLKNNGIGDYGIDVLEPRNYLAHGKPEINSDGGYTFTCFEKQFLFNDDASRDLREKIIFYKRAFNDIDNLLDE